MITAIIGILVIIAVTSFVYGWVEAYDEDPYIIIGLGASLCWIAATAASKGHFFGALQYFSCILGVVVVLILAFIVVIGISHGFIWLGEKLQRMVQKRIRGY